MVLMVVVGPCVMAVWWESLLKTAGFFCQMKVAKEVQKRALRCRT